MTKRIAVIGAGAAGLACADALGENLAALFECEGRAGGHALTVQVGDNKATKADIGFIVYNNKNYPRFSRLLARKGIAGRNTQMSFSVMHEAFGMEYNGGSLRGLFADPGNLLRRRFWRLLFAILRFNARARNDLRAGGPPAGQTLADYVAQCQLPDDMLNAYLLPMGAAIWSCSCDDFSRAPARFVLGFYDNHGLLQLFCRPQWMHIPGGSCRYVKAITDSLPPGVFRANTPVRIVRADTGGVVVGTDGGEELFDAAVLAVHAPDALRMLSPPSAAEVEVLSAFSYTPNKAVLHNDDSILPRRQAARACWNYRLFGHGKNIKAAATYHLSMLQHLPIDDAGAPLLLTLNDGIGKINPAKIIARYDFAHPLPDAAAIRAQGRRDSINGKRGLFFCGAYWGNGFHEDAVASGEDAAAAAMDYFNIKQ